MNSTQPNPLPGKRPRRSVAFPTMVSCACLLFTITGCTGGGSSESSSIDESKLQALAKIYSYAAQDKRTPPQGWSDLDYLIQQSDIADPEAYFVSSRDGNPYVVMWGLDAGQLARGHNVVIAYEAEGTQGKRWVVTSSTRAQEVTEEVFNKLTVIDGKTASR